MPAPNEAAQFNLRLRRCENTADCAALFRAAVAPYRFDTFACGELDLKRKERHAFFVIDWPDDWRRFCLGNNIMDRDPVVDMLPRFQQPFTWGDILNVPDLSRSAREVIAMARNAGWTEGLVVPIPRGTKDRYGLMSLVGKGPTLDLDTRALLSLMSICFFDFVRSLVPKCGFAAAPAGLTAREMECIRLVAQGKSDRVIAKMLGISHATAHEHVESAKRKLSTSTRAEMIGVAASMAIVTP
jgi:DNA-binding CsgD family transcriptional regulator